MDSPVVLDWGPACCTEVEPQVVAIPRASDNCGWHILSCPWWLSVKEDDDQLILWPRNCGRHQGQVRREIDGVESCMEVRSCVRPTWVLAIWTAFKVLLVGVATIVLAVILGFVCGIVIPLFGGPPGVAIAGSVIGTFFLATGLISEATVFALGMAIGGAVVGAALGKVAGGRRKVFVSAVVGLLAWLVASLPIVSAAAGGKGAGPAILFGMMFTPGTGLTIWGIVMGVLLAPCPAMTTANDATPTAAALPVLLADSDEVN